MAGDAAEAPSVNTTDMIRISGGTFRMGSNEHYPEEAPVHRVTASDFWIDRTPVTNRQFRAFVQATGHVTFAEIPPDPKHYPGAQRDRHDQKDQRKAHELQHRSTGREDAEEPGTSALATRWRRSARAGWRIDFLIFNCTTS